MKPANSSPRRRILSRPALISVALMVCHFSPLAHPKGAQAEEGAWKHADLQIVPTPKECRVSGREFPIGRAARIAIVAGKDTPIIATAAHTLARFLNRKGFAGVRSAHAATWPDADLTILVGGPDVNALSERAARERRGLRPTTPLQPQGYSLYTFKHPGPEPAGVVAALFGADEVGTLYSVYTFLKSLRVTTNGLLVRELEISDEPALSVRGLSPQWAWYIGDRAPYDAALWGLDRWKQALDFMAEYRYNMLALCTYGKFPFPLERYPDRSAVDLSFKLWNPSQGFHTIRWTHPASRDDFLGRLVDYAHDRGIRVLIYSCLNLQDEVGSRQWTNEDEIRIYSDIQQHLIKRYGIDGFIFEAGEFRIQHPDDVKRFGRDEWTRLKADLFLTHRYNQTIRAVKPDAAIGLVSHYLFRDWDEHKVPQQVGLERWKAELPPDALVAYVHSPEAYKVFSPDRIWTYVFGPKGGLRPAIQLHLADFCDEPRQRHAAGSYFVTYDWQPHEPSYLCFAESAWGNYGGGDDAAFTLHPGDPGVGGNIGGRVWAAIQREFYGDGSQFGEGLRLAAQGTYRQMKETDATLHLRRAILEELVPALDAADFSEAERFAERVRSQLASTQSGLTLMGRPPVSAPAMVSEYPLHEHFQKAVCLARAQLAWTEFVEACYATIIGLARQPASEDLGRIALGQLREKAATTLNRIRLDLSTAYFSYPYDRLVKFESLAAPNALLELVAGLRARFLVETGPDGRRLQLYNVAPQAAVTADSTYLNRGRPDSFKPQFATDGSEGTLNRGIWLSVESDGPHFLEMRFDRVPLVRAIAITWARDARQDLVPREFVVQVLTGKQWKTVHEVKDNTESMALVKLDLPARVEQARVVISRGSASRPRLAAINEVQVLALRE